MQTGIEKQFSIIIPDVSHTGGGWGNNGPVIRKVTDELFAQFPGLFPEAGIERHLSAAGLVFVVVDLNPEFFKDPDHVHTRFRVNLIDKTGYKNINGHYEGNRVNKDIIISRRSPIFPDQPFFILKPALRRSSQYAG